MNLLELIYPRFHFDKSKPIRMFEAFSGVGCQAMALKRITDKYELVGFSEIDKHAIKSYLAIHGEVKNYGDITKMVTIPECDIFTYSFPCTDLSKAGKQKGLSGGTRSGLVYEVLRLLHDTERKPKVLIMENVIDLVQVKFVDAFNAIQKELEELVYANYNEVLNAVDFDIPQNRARVFMVSILGDEVNPHYSYDFPIKRPLKIRLKDVLEENVDEKYYLSKKALQGIINTTTTSATILIKEATSKGYAEASDGDGVYINRPHQKRGVVQKGMTQTIKTSGNDIGVVVSELKAELVEKLLEQGKVQEFDVIRHSYTRNRLNNGEKNMGRVESKDNNMSPTLDTRCDCLGVVVQQKARGYNKGGQHELCPPITSNSFQENNHLLSGLRIRKLTPLECWRLMGISDEDFYKAKNAGVSDSQLYKQAGNGIVVNVFEAILRELIK